MALQQTIDDTVRGLGYDLVEVERSAGGADWLVRFYPDRDSVGLVEILLVH